MASDVHVNAFEQQLAALTRQIEELARPPLLSEQEYFRGFLDAVVRVLGVGGALYARTGAGEVSATCHTNLAAAGLQADGPQSELVPAALQKVWQSRGPVVLPGNAASNLYDAGLGEAAVNRSPHSLLFVPIVSGDQVYAVFLLISPEDVDPRAVRGYAGFVVGLCDRAAAFLQEKRLEQLNDQVKTADRYRDYVSALHSSLDPRRACFALANFGQELLNAYRCLAGTYNARGKFRMEAVSGLESVAVKSSLIQGIAEIARHVCRNGKPLIVDNPEAARNPQPGEDDLLTAARAYMLQAGSQVVAIFPIARDQRVVGALVIEKAKDEPFDPDQRRRIEAFLEEAGPALANALAYRTIPLGPAVRAAAALRDRVYRLDWGRRALFAAILAAIVATPFLVPWQVKAVGTAELVPVDSRIAYAAQDGVIESVTITDDNRRVNKADVLASLDTRFIDAEIDRVRGAIAEALLALDEETLRNGRSSLAARQEKAIDALRAELATLQVKREEFQIVAPIQGLVIDSDSTLRSLPGKPVRRGDAVLEIVPDTTDWQLLVLIDEDEAGDLLTAWQNAQGSLNARLILNAYPDTKFKTRVLSVSRRAHVQETGEQKYRNVLEVRVAEPDRLRQEIEPRQGLQGKVAIECGRKSLFYAVTHEFANFLRVSFF